MTIKKNIFVTLKYNKYSKSIIRIIYINENYNFNFFY